MDVFPTKLTFSLTVYSRTSHESRRLTFFTLSTFVLTTGVVLVHFQQQQSQNCTVACKPHCVVCGAKAHRTKQLPGAFHASNNAVVC